MIRWRLFFENSLRTAMVLTSRCPRSKLTAAARRMTALPLRAEVLPPGHRGRRRILELLSEGANSKSFVTQSFHKPLHHGPLCDRHVPIAPNFGAVNRVSRRCSKNPILFCGTTLRVVKSRHGVSYHTEIRTPLCTNRTSHFGAVLIGFSSQVPTKGTSARGSV